MAGSIMTRFRGRDVTLCAKKPAAVHKCCTCTKDEKSDSGAHFRPHVHAQRPVKPGSRLGPGDPNLHLAASGMPQWPAPGPGRGSSPRAPETKRTQI